MHRVSIFVSALACNNLHNVEEVKTYARYYKDELSEISYISIYVWSTEQKQWNLIDISRQLADGQFILSASSVINFSFTDLLYCQENDSSTLLSKTNTNWTDLSLKEALKSKA